MSVWNYRVVRRMVGGERELRIHEVYYDGQQITAWSSEPIAPSGQTHEELLADLRWMIVATTQSVLDEVDLPGQHREGASG